jgi:dsRNA-specific ribonuclease
MLVEENLENSGIKIKLMDKLILMPSILINVERLANVREFKIYNKFLFMKNYPLLKALSSRSFDKIMNNETLETLGDSVLKTIITLHLYTSSDTIDENQMTQNRADKINNKYLGANGEKMGLQYFLKTEFTPVKKWLPPNYAHK